MMKKFILFSVFCFSCIASFSQKKIDSWSCSYFDKEYDIECSPKEGNNEEFELYIGISGESQNRKVCLNISSTNLPLLIDYLNKIKVKFSEWRNIAKENNVTDTSKEMDFISPKMTVCWQGSKWFFSFNQRLTPKFIVLKDGRCAVSMYKRVTSSSNQYIDEKIYWVLSSPEEIDELISKIQPSKILEKLNQEKKANDLFI